MLGKLLKYDLKWCFKPLVVFFGLAIFFSTIVRFIESFEQSLILLIIDKICCGIVISILISIVINCCMRNWARFIKNIYKDEAYLTHTLPVSKNEIYLSKILTIIITLLASFIVIIVCLAISCLNENTWNILKVSLEQTAVYFDSSVISLIVVMLITIFFEFLFMVMSGIFGIIVGHKSNNLKMIKSIAIGFILYMILSSISLGVLYICGLLNSDLMAIFHNTEVSAKTMKSMMLIAICVYAVYNIGIYFIGNKILSKGVNVD